MLTHWEHIPTGNSPDFNPLDCNLFKDLHDDVKLNLLLIHRGNADCEIHMNGSKNIEDTYKYVMMGSPNDERIIEDITKIPYKFLRVYKNYGCIVKGIGQNNGIRYIKNVEIWNHQVRTSVQDDTNTYKERSKEVEYKFPELSGLALEGLTNMIDKSLGKFEF